MNVRDLINKLSTCDPEAQVKFFVHEKDIYLDINSVDAGKLKGKTETVIVGECSIYTKIQLSKIPKKDEGLTSIFEQVFGKSK